MCDGLTEATTAVALLLTIIALGVSIWAVRLAKKADETLGALESLNQDVLGLTDSTARNVQEVHEIAEGIEQALADFTGRSKAHREAQDAALDEIRTLINAVGSTSDDEIEEAEDTAMDNVTNDEDALRSLTHMSAVSLSEVPGEVISKVRSVSKSKPEWTLRRRGRGRPRWLIGTSDGSAWRATLRADGPYVSRAAHSFADKIRPTTLGELHPQARSALARELGVEPETIDADTVVYHRVEPGVPVYFALVRNHESNSTTVVRLVRTRWGWSASRESDL